MEKKVVVSNDNLLAIKTFYKLCEDTLRDIEEKLKGEIGDALIRILQGGILI